eukprot:scaffold21361_cov52-Prasinocladus_malaysianus.AAC.1
MAVPADFSLAQSICSYGYFSLAPNVWLPAPADEHEDVGIFCRPLACTTTWASHPSVQSDLRIPSNIFASDAVVQRSPGIDSRQTIFIIIMQLRTESCINIEIRSRGPLLPGVQTCACLSVRRMLRLDQDLEAWFSCHALAKQRGFGRTYRSPTVFEDMVKTITNCNVRFKRTIDMNRLLCKEFGADKLAFPHPSDLANVDIDDLRKRAQVGYRADRIIRLAKAFVEGKVVPM